MNAVTSAALSASGRRSGALASARHARVSRSRWTHPPPRASLAASVDLPDPELPMMTTLGTTTSLRTPDERFAAVPDFPWTPHYVEDIEEIEDLDDRRGLR